MNYKKLLILLSLLIIVISGCSKDNNKANLDEDIFEAGKQIVKLYAQAYNEVEGAETEANSLANSFLSEYEDGDYGSEDEEYFVSEIKLLQTVYSLYSMQEFTDEMTGSSESDETKEEIRESLLQIKDEYGISLE